MPEYHPEYFNMPCNDLSIRKKLVSIDYLLNDEMYVQFIQNAFKFRTNFFKESVE